MARSIKPHDLGDAIAEQLTQYHADVVKRLNAAGLKAIKKLVSLTKKNAPKDSGDYAKSITFQQTDLFTGDAEYTWGAKAPHYRKTHLLVNGHATVNGGRVPGDPFLEKALESVLPEYEEDVEGVLSE